MQIGINAQLLVNRKRTGIENYIFYLIDNLAKIDDKNEYVIFCKDKNGIPVRVLSKKNFRLCTTVLPIYKRNVRIFREHLLFPIHIFRERIDVYHGLSFVLPVLSNCPSVLSFVDLLAMTCPRDDMSYLTSMYLKLLLPITSRKAMRIISISDYTKNEGIEKLGLCEEKMVVTYLGVDESFRKITDTELLRKVRLEYGLPEKLILFVGALKPRRNVFRLVNAYALLKKRKPISHRLVITGVGGPSSKQILTTVAKLGLEKEVVFLDYVPKEVLPVIYNLADLFVYPSLYDGFGLPSLEAMACGTPVIASNVSSLPEVVGDAGLQIDPYNVEEMSEAMWRVLSDDGLRAEMCKKGMERAKSFTWEKCARETLAVYKTVYENSHK